MGLNFSTLAAAKKYVNETVSGAGAIKGEPGKDGVSVKSMTITSDNMVIATLSDNSVIQVGKLQTIVGSKGDKGETGDTPHIDEATKRWFIGDFDTGYVAVPKSEISFYDLTDIPNIPLSLSQLVNDEYFIKNTVNNLINYYSKDETFSKQEVTNLIRNINQLTTTIVDVLPTENISGSTIYLISAGASTYSQHMYIDNSWANLGNTNIDLNNYITTSELENVLSTKSDFNHIHDELHSHPNKPILDSITNELIQKWNSKFSGNYNDLTNKPNIPKITNDLTNELKSKYDTVALLSHDHKNKLVIDKFSEDDLGNILYNGDRIQGENTSANVEISSDSGNAIIQKNDGLYVVDQTVQIDSLKKTFNQIATKSYTLNEQCYYFGTANPGVGATITVSGENIIIPSYYDNIVGNMEYNSDGYVKLLKGNTYLVKGSVLAGGNLTYVISDNNNTIYGAKGYVSVNSYNCCEPTAIISPKEDTLITMKLGAPPNTKLYIDFSFLSIEEIGSRIEFNPLEYVNKTDGIEDTPIGHILSHLGTVAPKHYLICDGSVYNILDYPHLANHICEQFGSYNHFGGDGTNTFAVPDLRNQFLRGYHCEADDKLSDEIGKHQNATKHVDIRSSSSNVIGVVRTNVDSDRAIDQDSTEGKTKLSVTYNVQTIAGNEAQAGLYTSRPTNVAVLYCIKYEPTYFMNIASTLHT